MDILLTCVSNLKKCIFAWREKDTLLTFYIISKRERERERRELVYNGPHYIVMCALIAKKHVLKCRLTCYVSARGRIVVLAVF